MKTLITKRILGEPYIHFLLIGLLLYPYYQTFHKPPTLTKRQSIVITAAEIEDINYTKSKQWGRALRSSELGLMIDASYFDAILLHEAVSLELERRDREIRAKLISQMRQILNPTPIEPSEETIYRYYQKHVEDYSLTREISFAHIYLQNLAEIDSKSFVEMLNLKAIEPQDASEYGDRSVQSNQIPSSTQAELTKLFGKYFTREVWRLKSKKWHRVLRSRYGYHIIYIIHKQCGEPLPFAEVEDRVYSDYIQERSDNALQSAYRKLSTQYRVERR